MMMICEVGNMEMVKKNFFFFNIYIYVVNYIIKCGTKRNIFPLCI